MKNPIELNPSDVAQPPVKRRIRRWVLRAGGGMLVVLSVSAILLLNPGLLYAHRTAHGRFTVYHQTPLDPAFKDRLDNISDELDQCELANADLSIEICLGDGSIYPTLLAQFFSPTFAQSYSNKMMLRGTIDWPNNAALFPGTRWNLEQLIAHEATHCLQLSKFGVWEATFPTSPWKWEGYAEYVARQNPDQKDLAFNIRRLLEAEKQVGRDGRVAFADGTDVDMPYYRYWLLVQYCLDVKKMTYQALVEDTTAEAVIQAEIIAWYERQDGG